MTRHPLGGIFIQDRMEGDEILSEIMAASLMCVMRVESGIVLDVGAFLAHMKAVGYTVTLAKESVTFTIVNG